MYAATSAEVLLDIPKHWYHNGTGSAFFFFLYSTKYNSAHKAIMLKPKLTLQFWSNTKTSVVTVH